MRGLVDEFRNDKRNAHDDGPLDTVHPVGCLVTYTTCCLIDMWLEETHHRGDEVPGEIDGSEEDHCANGNLVGEQHFDIIHQTALLNSILLCCEFRTLLQLTLQIPCYESHHKQGEEHDT